MLSSGRSRVSGAVHGRITLGVQLVLVAGSEVTAVPGHGYPKTAGNDSFPQRRGDAFVETNPRSFQD